MKKLIIITLAIIAISVPGYACNDWALSGSYITGSKFGGRVVNRCTYQSLSGSGETLSVEMPMGTQCHIILDPCPEGESKTEVIVNQHFEAPDTGMKQLHLKKLNLKKIGE